MAANDNRSRSNLESAIGACVQKGNVVQAELLCREYIELVPDSPAAFNILGVIAQGIGAYSFAKAYYDKAIEIDSSFLIAKQNRARLLVDSVPSVASTGKKNSDAKKFLLVKAWGYGFWSDVDHVLGQLLLAEMTGRIPIIHWGKNSLFKTDTCSNAFDLYFQSVSAFTINDLEKPTYSFFPPKWRYDNLTLEDLSKWTGQFARVTGLLMLHREEDVVVSDFHTPVISLLPWLPREHEDYGSAPETIYRRLFNKYIKLKPHLLERAQVFWNERMAGRKWLAVHVRGTDKVAEIANNDEVNTWYGTQIERFLDDDQSLCIFLMTDSRSILNAYLQRYGSKILSTDSLRLDGKVGVHYAGLPGQKVAEEVIQDVLLAGSCDYFLGNGGSNVSTSIQHLKRWPEGTYRLMTDNFLYRRNLFVHNW